MPRPKWSKWEFWPFWLFYIPVYIFIFIRGFIRRSLTFFLSANPGLPYGGFVEYPKDHLLGLLPQKVVPVTRTLEEGSSAENVLETMKKAGLEFPIILKPNVGERGFGVEKIHDRLALEEYLKGAQGVILLQEYVSTLMEYGVMVARDPDQNRFEITSLVVKAPLIVHGDGKKTLGQIIKDHPRGQYHWQMLQDLYAQDWEQITTPGKDYLLVEIGNHNRGSTFLNGNHLIGPELEEVFDKLAKEVPGFFIGRFDVKAQDPEALRQGDFKIMELNGVNSEPAHIYDPEMPLFQAYVDLLRHWQRIETISKKNIALGHQPESLSELRHAIKEHYANQSKAESIWNT
jgi:hypothetical protein